jgi:hypothetical protein
MSSLCRAAYRFRARVASRSDVCCAVLRRAVLCCAVARRSVGGQLRRFQELQILCAVFDVCVFRLSAVSGGGRANAVATLLA